MIRRHPWPMTERPDAPAPGKTVQVGWYRVRCTATGVDARLYELLPPAAEGSDEVLLQHTSWYQLCAEVGWYPDDTVGGQAAARYRHARRFEGNPTFNLDGALWTVVGTAVVSEWRAVLHLQRDEQRITITIDPDNTIIDRRPSCRAASTTPPSPVNACSTSSRSPALVPSTTSEAPPSTTSPSTRPKAPGLRLVHGSKESPPPGSTSSSTPAKTSAATDPAEDTTSTADSDRRQLSLW